MVHYYRDLDIPPVKSRPQNITTTERKSLISLSSTVSSWVLVALWGLGYTGIHFTVADTHRITTSITA